MLSFGSKKARKTPSQDIKCFRSREFAKFLAVLETDVKQPGMIDSFDGKPAATGYAQQ